MTIDMAHVARRATVTIRIAGPARFRVRLWIASWLIRAAAAVAGCGCKIAATEGGSL